MSQTYGPYSPVRQAGNYYFVSGQIGVGADSTNASPEVVTQTKQVLQNLTEKLTGAGLEPADVVKTTVFLKNMSDFGTVNQLYAAYFPNPKPARSCVEVAGLPRIGDTELLLEIEAVAYKKNKSV